MTSKIKGRCSFFCIAQFLNTLGVNWVHREEQDALLYWEDYLRYWEDYCRMEGFDLWS